MPRHKKENDRANKKVVLVVKGGVVSVVHKDFLVEVQVHDQDTDTYQVYEDYEVIQGD